MDRTFEIVTFALMCVLCLALLLVLGILVFARRRVTPLSRRLMVFYLLAPLGAFLCEQADYWNAFGSPPGHAALPKVVRLCSFCAYGAAFWIARRPLGQLTSRFVRANGGTAGAALRSALLHPGVSIDRLHTQKMQETVRRVNP